VIKKYIFTETEMDVAYITEKIFDKNNFKDNPLPKGDYENCTFKNCEFSNADLSYIKFIECTFLNCNLSLSKLIKTSFRDVKFTDCKMLGLLFYNCNEFGLSVGFDNCSLDHSSFYRTKIKKTIFRNSRLNEVDFTECDLTNSVFENCDMLNTKFEKTIIEKADFRTSYNYSIDPENNRIKKAKFSFEGIPGLLDKYDIEISG
jgi:fluoroquinolone resistance protein